MLEKRTLKHGYDGETFSFAVDTSTDLNTVTKCTVLSFQAAVSAHEHSTAQHSTAQHSTAQHSTTQRLDEDEDEERLNSELHEDTRVTRRILWPTEADRRSNETKQVNK